MRPCFRVRSGPSRVRNGTTSFEFALKNRSLKLLNTACSGPPCHCLRGLPHYIDLNYVGKDMAREVLGHVMDTMNSCQVRFLRNTGPEIPNFFEAGIY